MTEAQLRSWQPRRPAARLKGNIFATERTIPTATWLWGGLAPTMACLFLTLMVLNHAGDGLSQRQAVTMVLSNQSYAAYAAGDMQTAQNHLATVTFDSTNRSSFRSIIGFTPTTNFSN